MNGLKAGDILHVKLGTADMGDGLPPWLPTLQECEEAKKEWEAVVPAGVKVIVTHFGNEAVVDSFGLPSRCRGDSMKPRKPEPKFGITDARVMELIDEKAQKRIQRETEVERLTDPLILADLGKVGSEKAPWIPDETDINGSDEPHKEWRKDYPVESRMQRHDDIARRKLGTFIHGDPHATDERLEQLLDGTRSPSGLRSEWTDRAVLELERTGARRALQGPLYGARDTIVVP